MKCGPDGCPIVAFSDLTRTEQRVRRKRIAEKMTDVGFTQEQIAKQLGVSQSQIQRDLGGLPAMGKPPRPKGGRPKGSKSKRSSKVINPCDYDWSNIQEADFGNPTQAYRAQAEHYRREATSLATGYPLLSKKIDLNIITDLEIQAVRKVAQAWLTVVETLTQRQLQHRSA